MTQGSRRTTRIALAIGACAVLVAATYWLGRGPSGSGLKVIVIGLDGANTAVISPLLEAGRLPNLERFLSRAAGGHLDSPADKWESAAIWTSMVTGVRPECHGVYDFMLPAENEHGPISMPNPADPTDPEQRIPDWIWVQSGHRKVKALWNVLSDHGLESAVLGLWGTWPAERIHGVIVSERLTESRIRESTEYRIGDMVVPLDARQEWGLVSPESFIHDVSRLKRPPGEIEPEMLRRFADFADDEIAALRARKFVGSMNMATDPLVELRNSVQSDRSHAAMAEFVDEAVTPDLLFLYLEGVDIAEHQFFGHHKDSKFVAEPERTRFKDVLNRYHEFTDELIAPYLERASPDTVVIVVSDHGFALVEDPEWLADPKKPKWWHDRNAILFAAGGPIVPGARVSGRVYDLAPTVLALLGLPVGARLEGRVLTEMIDPEFLARYPIETVASHGAHVRQRLPRASSGSDDDLIAKMKAQGYLGGGTLDEPVKVTKREIPPQTDVDCRRCHDGAR
jgi:predicted AlkP superfamily phosphohydrolase/phosphomutase